MNTRKAALAAVILSSLLLGQPLSGGTAKSTLPLKSKTAKKTALKPHPQANQSSVDATGKHTGQDYTIREWDGSFYVEASLLSWEGNDRTVSLALAIANTTNQTPSEPTEQSFAPGTMVVILPNGHSYRPFNQGDVLQNALAAENGGLALTPSRFDPPLATIDGGDCSLSSDIATCRTNADQSLQAGYVVGFALGGEIENAFARRDARKYIKQVKEAYLVSRPIPPGAHAVGYVDFYIEDIHSGPFTVRIPAGSKTYDFVFGPEEIAFELPKKD